MVDKIAEIISNRIIAVNGQGEDKEIYTYTLIHTISGDYISYKSMKEHQGKLNNNFIRCHSSYIVNMEYIKDYQGYEINLLNNDKIWVSKNRRKEFCIL